jgi:hypothetical protein
MFILGFSAVFLSRPGSLTPRRALANSNFILPTKSTTEKDFIQENSVELSHLKLLHQSQNSWLITKKP